MKSRSWLAAFVGLLCLSAIGPPHARASSRYQSLLATSAGRDSLLNLAAWEDSRVAGNGKLFSYLKSDNPLIRLRAVEVVGRIQDPQDVAHLLPLLRDADDRVVQETILALGQIGSEKATAPLLQLNKRAQAATQCRIAEALGKIGGDEASAGLQEMLQTFNGSVRGAACLGLARAADANAVSALLLAIHDGDTKVAWRAIYALEKVTSERVRAAVEPFLDHDDPVVRAYAARTLGKQKAEKSKNGLIALLDDSDERVVINTIVALSKIFEDKKDRDIAAPMIALVRKHASHHVRKAAIMALGTIGHKSAKDCLVQSMLDRQPGIRAESYKSLAKVLGRKSSMFLLEGLNDGNKVVRAAVIESCGIAGIKKQLNYLIETALDDKDPITRAAAVRALGRFEREDVGGTLQAKLSDEDWVVCNEAVTALGKTGDESAVPLLIERFELARDRTDMDVRLEILKVLKTMKASESEGIARAALDDSDPRARAAAVELLEAIGATQPDIKDARYFYERDVDPSRKTDLVLPFGSREVVLSTERGRIEIEVFGDDATQTAANFLKLVESKFYDGLNFHRVVANFVIQGGCPRGDGWGDPGYNIRSEFNHYTYERGYVGIAHSGKDTGGCQFFITHSPQPRLNGRYTIFGRVTKGMDVVDKICVGDRFTAEIVE